MAEGVEVISNHHWRDLLCDFEVPAEVLAAEFDFIGDTSCESFFSYRGEWYYLGDFMRVEQGGDLERAGWDGYCSDSFFSGVVIRLDGDLERVQVGLYLS